MFPSGTDTFLQEMLIIPSCTFILQKKAFMLIHTAPGIMVQQGQSFSVVRGV